MTISYELTQSPDQVVKLDSSDGSRRGVPRGNDYYWSEYEEWLSQGNIPTPYVPPVISPDPVPTTITASQEWVNSKLSELIKTVTLRHQMVSVVLGSGGVAVADLSSLGYADFEVLPQVTINGTAVSSMRLVTSTASNKDISGTNRKITLTGRRIKAVAGVSDLLTGLWENAVSGDTVQILVFEKSAS